MLFSHPVCPHEDLWGGCESADGEEVSLHGRWAGSGGHSPCPVPLQSLDGSYWGLAEDGAQWRGSLVSHTHFSLLRSCIQRPSYSSRRPPSSTYTQEPSSLPYPPMLLSGPISR